MAHLKNAVLMLLVCLSPNLTAQAPDRNPPNVLLIMVDDLRPLLGAYGAPMIQTPHINQLATTGYVFENAFAVVPVCGASRAALLSGRKPTTNRFVSYDARLDEDLPEAPSLPGHFQKHGYQTLAYGKVFDNMLDSQDAWSKPVWSPRGDWNSPTPPGERGEELQKAYLGNPADVRGPAFERLLVNDSDYPDGKIADQVAKDLATLQRSPQPFFLAVGFRKPHLPFNAPERYWNLYDPKDLQLPSTYRQPLDGAPANPFHMGELRQYAGIPGDGPLQDPQALNLIHAYYAAVSYVDAQVGKVLDALDQAGLANGTIVVLLGDHGFNLGEHTLWTKHNLSELALRTPLIIRDPSRADGRISGVTDFLDIFPTLTELADLPVPEALDGASLVPMLDDTTATVKTASISRWFNATSVRTPRFRYTQWRSEDGSVTAHTLFDLLADPDETRNIADAPKHKNLVSELNKIIDDDDSNSPWSPLIRRIVNG